MSTYRNGRIQGLTLEMGWGVHDQLMGGLVITPIDRDLCAFRIDPKWTAEEGERRYALYSQWNDFTGEVSGSPCGWCLESDIGGLL